MSALRFVGISLVIIVLLGSVLGAVYATEATSDSINIEEELDIDADDIVLRIALAETGDATVSTEYRIALDTSAERDAFDELADEIEANESTYLDLYETRFGPVVEEAAELTTREMEMTDLSVSTDTRTTVDRQYGVVTFSFTWTEFAVVDGDELIAGDALAGLFLNEDTHLVIEWPDDFTLVEAVPTPGSSTDRSVSWTGPLEFGDGEPQVTVSSADDVAPIDDDDGVSMLLLAAAAILVVVLSAGGWWFYRRQNGVSDTQVVDTTDPSNSGELLSNEERVLQLVRERGGRMKQKEVADELDWTAAKTSKVVGNLRDEGDLEAFRLGRENVIRLPEEDDEL